MIDRIILYKTKGVNPIFCMKDKNKLMHKSDIAKEINYLTLLNKELKNIEEKQLIKYASKSAIRDKVKKNKLLEVFKFGENDELINFLHTT